MVSIKTFFAVAVASTAIGVGMLEVAPAQALSFNFSYTQESGDVLSGGLEGEIQSDGDTVFVSSITQNSFNGIPGVGLPFITSVSNFFTGSLNPATVSFSGSVMDIIASTDQLGNDGFLLETTGLLGEFPASYEGGPSYSGESELYDPNRWSLTVATPIPTPSLIPGVIGMGLSLLRKRKSEHAEAVKA